MQAITEARPLHIRITLESSERKFMRHLTREEAADLLDKKVVVAIGRKPKVYAVQCVPEKPVRPEPGDFRPRCQAPSSRMIHDKVPGPRPLVHRRDDDENPHPVLTFEKMSRNERQIFLGPVLQCANPGYRSFRETAGV